MSSWIRKETKPPGGSAAGAAAQADSVPGAGSSPTSAGAVRTSRLSAAPRPVASKAVISVSGAGSRYQRLSA